MSVDVGRNQLRASFTAQRDASRALGNGAPAALLLFYGAECGLKAALLDRRGLRSTSQLLEPFRSHDLRRLAKELGLPLPLRNRMSSSACQRKKEQVAFEDLHQAWRYGRALDKDHEEQALDVLRELSDWCQRELRV